MVKLNDSLKIDIVDDIKSAGGSDLVAGDIPYDSEEDLTETLIPSFVSKPPPTDEIFDEDAEEPSISLPSEAKQSEDKPAPEIKVVAEPEPVPQVITKPVKLTKKGKPRKPMSDEHKEKLKQSREKAMARKKYLAEQRAITKSQDKEIKEKEFKLKQSLNKKKLDELNSQMPPEPAPAPAPAPAPLPTHEEVAKKMSSTITMKDLEDMSLKTVITMETLRKKRKEAKKAKQQEQQYQNEVIQSIKQAQPSWYIENSPYNGAF